MRVQTRVLTPKIPQAPKCNPPRWLAPFRKGGGVSAIFRLRRVGGFTVVVFS